MSDYVVERIEGKRIINGVTQYFLKWQGYPRSENTWEPVENLSCPEFIAAFEKSENKLKVKKRRLTANEKTTTTTSATGDRNGLTIPHDQEIFGFERGLAASKILGATNSSGKLMFLMSWKNSNYIDLVPAKLANVKCPQIVIKFYEERLTWESDVETKKTKIQKILKGNC